MTLEVQPNPQSPEGISAQQQERFEQLQTGILGRVEPHQATIVVTSDSRDPVGGYNLSVSKQGRWSINFGREGMKFLGEPVELLELLKKYAFIQNSSRLAEMVRHEPDPKLASESTSKYLDEIRKLDESVEDNPGPFAESFLKEMQNTLEQLS